jgi:hypothetical protein
VVASRARMATRRALEFSPRTFQMTILRFSNMGNGIDDECSKQLHLQRAAGQHRARWHCGIYGNLPVDNGGDGAQDV